jgi:hypothetical protein
MSYYNICILVHMGTVINVNKVYVWFAYGYLANSLAYHFPLGFITETVIVNSLGLLWMNDQPPTESCTWQHTTLTSIPQWYLNPQSQQLIGCRPTPKIVRPLVLALHTIGVQKYQLVILCLGSNSIVGIAVCYGLDGLGIKSQCGQHSLHLSRPTLGPTQPPIQRVLGLFPRIKRPGPDVYHTPPSSIVPRLN